MYYKGKDKRIDEIGSELGVDYVLEGSVRRADDRVRIMAQLIQVSDQAPLWAETFERDFKDIFALQGEIARRITHTLVSELLPAGQTWLPGTRPINPEAYDAYLKGRYYATRYEFPKAIRFYKEAIRLDPDYALPYAALGHSHAMQMSLGQAELEVAEQAGEYIAKAAELAPGLAEVEMHFADLSFYIEWDWSAGEAGFRRAYETDPSSEEVVAHVSYYLRAFRRFDEAIEVLERALRLDPYSRQLNRSLVDTFVESHQVYRAIEQRRRMIEIEPQDLRLHNALGRLLEDLGRFDEAVETYLRVRRLNGDDVDRLEELQEAYQSGGIHGYWSKRAEHLMATEGIQNVPPLDLAFVYVRANDRVRALEWLEKAIAAQVGLGQPTAIANAYTQLGETDLALATLEKAHAQRHPFMVYLNAEVNWDPLRDHPRFQELVRRMEFPE